MSKRKPFGYLDGNSPRVKGGEWYGDDDDGSSGGSGRYGSSTGGSSHRSQRRRTATTSTTATSVPLLKPDNLDFLSNASNRIASDTKTPRISNCTSTTTATLTTSSQQQQYNNGQQGTTTTCAAANTGAATDDDGGVRRRQNPRPKKRHRWSSSSSSSSSCSSASVTSGGSSRNDARRRRRRGSHNDSSNNSSNSHHRDERSIRESWKRGFEMMVVEKIPESIPEDGRQPAAAAAGTTTTAAAAAETDEKVEKRQKKISGGPFRRRRGGDDDDDDLDGGERSQSGPSSSGSPSSSGRLPTNADDDDDKNENDDDVVAEDDDMDVCASDDEEELREEEEVVVVANTTASSGGTVATTTTTPGSGFHIYVDEAKATVPDRGGVSEAGRFAANDFSGGGAGAALASTSNPPTRVRPPLPRHRGTDSNKKVDYRTKNDLRGTGNGDDLAASAPTAKARRQRQLPEPPSLAATGNTAAADKEEKPRINKKKKSRTSFAANRDDDAQIRLQKKTSPIVDTPLLQRRDAIDPRGVKTTRPGEAPPAQPQKRTPTHQRCPSPLALPPYPSANLGKETAVTATRQTKNNGDRVPSPPFVRNGRQSMLEMIDPPRSQLKQPFTERDLERLRNSPPDDVDVMQKLFGSTGSVSSSTGPWVHKTIELRHRGRKDPDEDSELTLEEWERSIEADNDATRTASSAPNAKITSAAAAKEQITDDEEKADSSNPASFSSKRPSGPDSGGTVMVSGPVPKAQHAIHMDTPAVRKRVRTTTPPSEAKNGAADAVLGSGSKPQRRAKSSARESQLENADGQASHEKAATIRSGESLDGSVQQERGGAASSGDVAHEKPIEDEKPYIDEDVRRLHGTKQSVPETPSNGGDDYANEPITSEKKSDTSSASSYYLPVPSQAVDRKSAASASARTEASSSPVDSSPEIWTTEAAGFRNSLPIFRLQDGKRYRHPPMPPGWSLHVSMKHNRPYYQHPTHGITIFPPVLLPSTTAADETSAETPSRASPDGSDGSSASSKVSNTGIARLSSKGSFETPGGAPPMPDKTPSSTSGPEMDSDSTKLRQNSQALALDSDAFNTPSGPERSSDEASENLAAEYHVSSGGGIENAGQGSPSIEGESPSEQLQNLDGDDEEEIITHHHARRRSSLGSFAEERELTPSSATGNVSKPVASPCAEEAMDDDDGKEATTLPGDGEDCGPFPDANPDDYFPQHEDDSPPPNSPEAFRGDGDLDAESPSFPVNEDDSPVERTSTLDGFKLSSRFSVVVHENDGNWDDDISLLGDNDVSSKEGAKRGVSHQRGKTGSVGDSLAGDSRRSNVSKMSQLSSFSHRVVHPPLPICSLQNIEALALVSEMKRKQRKRDKSRGRKSKSKTKKDKRDKTSSGKDTSKLPKKKKQSRK